MTVHLVLAFRLRYKLAGGPFAVTTPVGFHFIIEMGGCSNKDLNDLQFVKNALVTAISMAELTLLGEISHRFEPQGITAIALLAESHFSIHTWPEYGYAGADLFTCGDRQAAEAACQYLVGALGAADHSLRCVPRGLPQSATTSLASPKTDKANLDDNLPS